MHSAWEASKRSMSVFSVLLPDFLEVNLVQILGAYRNKIYKNIYVYKIINIYKYSGLHRQSEMPVMSIIRFQIVIFRYHIHKAQYALNATTRMP